MHHVQRRRPLVVGMALASAREHSSCVAQRTTEGKGAMRQPCFRRIETTWSVLVLVAVAALAVGCGQAVASGNPLAQGWSWYQDGHYPFRVPIPPGWETATFSNTETGIQGCSYYEVYLFPPGRTPRSERGLEEHEPRLMTITLNLGCQPYYPEQANAGGLRWVPEKAPVTVSGLQVPMYDRNDPAGE